MTEPNHPVDVPRQQAVEFQGPMAQHHQVVVFGRLVRQLTAFPFRDGAERMVHLVVDDRHGIDMTLVEAERFIPFMAHCLAVGMGYFGFPDEPDAPLIRRDSNPFGRVFSIVAGVDAHGEVIP